MHETKRDRPIAYGVAVLATAITLAIRLLLWPVLGDAVPHMAFFPAVMIAAYYGGFWPGLVATILGAIAANVVFTEPHYVLGIKGLNAAIALPMFVLVGLIISGLSESLHRSRRHIASQRRTVDEAEVIRQVNERLELAVRGSNVGVWESELHNGMAGPARNHDVNVWEQLGYEGPPTKDATVLDVAYPGEADRVREQVRQYLAGETKQFETEIQLRHKDGLYRTVLARGAAIRDVAGKPIRFVGVSIDITRLKLTEEALRESEQRWRSLTEALPQLVWSATPDGDCDYFSTQWTEHTGVAEENLLGWRWLETLHPEDRETTRQFWLESVAEHHQYDVEYRVRHRDGEYRWFKTRGVPIRNGSGKIVKWFGSCTDITELRQIEEALRESEERFRGTFENASVGIAHVDITGRFARVNEKYCTIVGYPRDESTRKTVQDITHPDDLAASLPPLQAVLRGESPGFRMEKRYVRQDGSVVWVELSTAPQRGPADNMAYIISVIQDISERKRLERELRQAKDSAEAANRAKDEFLANVSHEIRTPMNAILGMTELALDSQLTDDQRQSLTTVKSAAHNLLGMINDLLDFAKIEAGKMELDITDFSLGVALGEIMRALATRAHNKGLELLYEIKHDVPDALVGDAGRLRQVLLNLVGNAIKFTERGEVAVEVRIAENELRIGSMETPDSELCTLQFSVRDTGVGIPREKHEYIFRAFEQEDTSTTRKYGGTGLGLTIASRLVELMHGHIAMDSEPGRGSTFTFTAQFARQPPRAEAAGSPAPSTRLDGIHVLVVDDNSTNRRILTEWLHGWQMEPFEASDAHAAMADLWRAVAEGQPYELVLLDSRMPKVDGLELAARIRQNVELAATRMILLTSGDRLGELAKSRELGIDAHLLKPADHDELLATIQRVMIRPANYTSIIPAAVAAAPPQAAAPLRILVAEDNEFNKLHLQQLLSRRGHQTCVASNGRETLAILGINVGSFPAVLRAAEFDLLILDLHMPEMDGFQVVRVIREYEQSIGKHLPIIALTARARKEDRERCLVAGMDDYLSKPLQAAELFSVIERLVPLSTVAQAGPPVAANLLSPTVLLAACDGDEEALRARCHDLQIYLHGRLAEARAAFETGDAPRLREEAHKLCGLLSVFSTKAAFLASDLEDQAAEGRLAGSATLMQELEKISSELLKQVEGLNIEKLQQQARAVHRA